MNMRDHLASHIDTHKRRGNPCSKKGYRCKLTGETI